MQVADKSAVGSEDAVDDVLAVDEPRLDRRVDVWAEQRKREHQRVVTVPDLVGANASVVLSCNHVGGIVPRAPV